MTKTATANTTANAEVTPLNDLVLKDALGRPLAKGQKVEHIRTGEQGAVVRLDKRSRRAVVEFDAGNVTMRQGHLLKVRTVKGKVLMVKQAVKSASKKV